MKYLMIVLGVSFCLAQTPTSTETVLHLGNDTYVVTNSGLQVLSPFQREQVFKNSLQPYEDGINELTTVSYIEGTFQMSYKTKQDNDYLDLGTFILEQVFREIERYEANHYKRPSALNFDHKTQVNNELGIEDLNILLGEFSSSLPNVVAPKTATNLQNLIQDYLFYYENNTPFYLVRTESTSEPGKNVYALKPIGEETPQTVIEKYNRKGQLTQTQTIQHDKSDYQQELIEWQCISRARPTGVYKTGVILLSATAECLGYFFHGYCKEYSCDTFSGTKTFSVWVKTSGPPSLPISCLIEYIIEAWNKC